MSEAHRDLVATLVRALTAAVPQLERLAGLLPPGAEHARNAEILAEAQRALTLSRNH